MKVVSHFKEDSEQTHSAQRLTLGMLFCSLFQSWQLFSRFEISDSLDDTDVLTPVSIDHPFLSSAGKIHYQKSGDSIVILFTTEYEEVSGYVWRSDDAAESWIENFYMIEALSDSWSMVQIYS